MSRGGAGWEAIGFERSVVVEDLDGDGDLDLLIAGADRMPVPYWNDGDAWFERGRSLPAPDDPPIQPDLFGVADVDGDGRPDVVGQIREQGLDLARQHDGGFEDPVHLPLAGGALEVTDALALGDLDGDGWVDAVPLSSHEEDWDTSATPSRVYRGDGDGLQEAFALGFGDHSVSSQAGAVLDVDRDGRAELLELTNTPQDGGLSSAVWTRQGDGWVDRAVELGLEARATAMGLIWSDLDEDGEPDLCVSDVGPSRCWMKRAGVWVEAGFALGIVPAEPVLEQVATVGWSLEAGDLDHDGHPEIVQASGFDRWAWGLGQLAFPDLVWSSDGERFADVTAEVGLDPEGEAHFGLALADLDGNGWLDVVTAGPLAPPRIHLAACGAGHWTQVELVGPPENTLALGARVEVTAGDRTWVVDLLGPRASGQSPSRAHVGLGDAERYDLIVSWPDGTRSVHRDVPADRLVTARHPDA